MVMVVAIIVAAAWYVLPRVNELLTDEVPLTNTLVSTSDVNLRSGPGTNYEILTVIPGGVEVAANTQPEAGFLQVDYNGVRGWTSASYLVAPNRVIAQSETVTDTAPEPEPTFAVVEIAPEPTQVPVQETPEPTAVPTYELTIAQTEDLVDQPQPGEKWIDVNRTTKMVTLYNGDIVVEQFDSLIGKDLSAEGYYSTALGTFYVYVMEKDLAETPFAEGVYLTDFVGFDPYRSNGFHSPVRDEFGNVVATGGSSTLGCVRLSDEDAIFLYNFAHIGMRVVVHD